MSELTIGKLAKLAGISRDAIRIYEREGLIENPKRMPNGYRVYSSEIIAHLNFILRAKSIGFTLKEIGDLLAIKHTKENTCEEVRAEAQEKLNHVNDKINELQKLKKALQTLINTCDHNKNASSCPLLNALENKKMKGGA